MSHNRLRLTLYIDDDGTAELTVEIAAGGFAGIGSAWFNLTELHAFAERLGEYPLQANPLPRLVGGYWGKTDGAELTQPHVEIDLMPHDARGLLRLTTRLATSFQDSADEPLQRRVVTHLIVAYSDLARLQPSFRAMLNGNASEVILDVEPSA